MLNWRTLLFVAAIALAACEQKAAPDDGANIDAAASITAVSRPRFELTTDEVFDAANIPAYSGNHDAIYAYIDDNLDEACRPSSTLGPATVDQCAGCRYQRDG